MVLRIYLDDFSEQMTEIIFNSTDKVYCGS